MKRLGFIFIIAGFLAASYATLLEADSVNWALFLPALLASVVGVAMVRTANRQRAFHADTVAANIDDIDKSLGAIVEKVSRLNREKETIHTYDMRHRIDDLLIEDLNTFVEARETIGVKFGLHEYADIMSHFAAGERYLNRVWSCSADGYIDEVHDYIGRAERQFTETLERFRALRRGRP